MKHLCLLLLLFSVVAHAQLSDNQLKELHDNTAKIESTSVKLQQIMKENQRITDSLNMVQFNKQNARNLDAFMAERKAQERKAAKQMYWRLGFGILMLVVLIVGLRRKRK